MIRWGLRLVVLLGLLGVLYVGVTFVQVWQASNQDDATPASAIVVMGAAQWNGRPSPVLQARLDHAAQLYRDGAAPIVVVTGGKQIGDAVTQGQSGYRYLREIGLPDEAIKVEVEGTNSYEELSASALIVDQAGTGRNVIVVTDPYHAERVEAIAREVGLDAHVSPTDSSTTLRGLVRETAAVAAGRIVGYRRLSSWLS
ncbi:MAG: YdcF family protein [Acidimicrobiales bacterium]|nr:YdcF family protein [Acidimicrobiales bacterium]